MLDPVAALPNKPFVDSLPFSVNDGTISNEIFIDQEDMLWISSYGGYLSRYDGSSSNSILLSEIYGNGSIDDWGRVWIRKFIGQTLYAGYLDLKSGKNHLIYFLDQNGRLLKHDHHLSLAYAQQAIWVIEKTGDLYRAQLSADIKDKSTLTFTLQSHISIHPSVYTQNISSSTASALTIDSLGHVWFALSDQLLRYDPNSKQWTDFSHVLKPGQSIDYGVNIAITNQHNTWIDMIGINTLFRIDRQDRATKIEVPYRLQNIVADPARNRIWIASTNGFYYLIGEDSTLYHYGAEPWQDVGVPSSTIRNMFIDRSNNLWFNSNKGVHVIRAMHDHVQRIIPTVQRLGKPADEGLQVILSLTRQNADTLWWLNRRQELVRYEIKTGHEQVFPLQFDTSLPSDEGHNIAYSNSLILVTTQSGRLLRFDTRSQRFLPSVETLLGNKGNVNTFLDFSPTDGGKIWFSGFYSDTGGTDVKTTTRHLFSYWDSYTQSLRKLSCHLAKDRNHDYTIATGLLSKSQYTDTVWLVVFSVSGNIVIQYSSQDQSCRSIKLPFETEPVQAVVQTDPDNLWLIQGNSLRQIRLSDQAVLYDQTLPLAAVERIENDHHGHFLMYGDNTLWRFDIVDQSWHPLYAAEVTTDSNSGFLPYFDEDNHQFYILSHQGILRIDTERTLELGKPKVMFTAFEYGQSKETLFPEQAQLTVPYGAAVEVSFVAVPMVPSKLQRFRYRFNAEQSWVYLGNRKLLFSQLPAGDLQLEMQVTYNHKDFGDSQFLKFTVLPVWWQTPWVYAVYGLISMVFVYLFIYWQRNQAQLQQAKLTENVFENTSEGLCLLSSDYHVLSINEAMATMMGWHQGENVLAALQQMTTVQEGRAVLDYFQEAEKNNRFQLDVQLEDSAGQQLVVELRVDTYQPKNSRKQYVVVIENISERKAHEQHLLYLSRHDHLTGLANRLAVDEHLAKITGEAHKARRLAIILLDLDDFKKINDSQGHKTGDLILQEIAAKLVQWAKLVPDEEEIIARIGGDEFLLVLSIQEEDSRYLENRLRILFTMINRLSVEVNMGASLAVTFFPDNSVHAPVLLQQVDMAMFHAKSSSKGDIVFYSNQFEQRLAYQIEIEKALLLNRGHFGLVLHYQPKVKIKSNRIYGVEALSRWRLADGSLLSPDKFLPLIRPGVMEKNFGLAVLRQACSDLIQFHTMHPDLHLAINVSPRLLQDDLFTANFRAILAEYGIDPKVIILEVLEDAGIGDDNILKNLQHLQQCGIAISIDDFGVGYSSLSHLSRLGANEMKSDKSFMDGIPGDETAELMFETIIAFGSKFNMQVVCEGIETQEQLDFIRARGCDSYQGYYFSRPLPAEGLKKLLVEKGKVVSETDI